MKRKILAIASSLILLSSCAASTTTTTADSGTSVILYNVNGSRIQEFSNAYLNSSNDIITYSDENGYHRLIVKTGYVEEITH